MPPPMHIVGKINMARIRIQKELDELLHMLHSDGPVIAMFSNPNVDLVQTLEVWKFSSQTFIEYMAPKNYLHKFSSVSSAAKQVTCSK